MSSAEKDIKKEQKRASVNPFTKLVEDKKKITTAIRNGKSLSTLKGIKFVKPL